MTCDAIKGCPPDTHNLHCGYPDCAKGRAVSVDDPMLAEYRKWMRSPDLVAARIARIAALETEIVQLKETVAKYADQGVESGQNVSDLRAENARLREALGRLGRSEAMTTSFAIDTSAASVELLARINYARAALEAGNG